jgi:hypothetical protein
MALETTGRITARSPSLVTARAWTRGAAPYFLAAMIPIARSSQPIAPRCARRPSASRRASARLFPPVTAPGRTARVRFG